MRKVSLVLSLVVLAAMAVLALPSLSSAQETGKAKELRWHGTLVRKSEDGSVLTVRKGNVERAVHVDSSTQWTKTGKGNKVEKIDPSEVKEGADIICLGTEENKEFHATRVDLRLPK